MFSSLLRRRGRRRPARGQPPPRFRPRVEPLEDRVLLSHSPLGPEFLANLNPAVGFAPAAVVASDAAGDIVVAWTSASEGSFGDVRARLFDPAGNPRGGEIDVSGGPVFAPTTIDVAMDAAGDFVITWSSYGQDGSGWGVYAQRYNAAGVAQGGEFRVNTTTTGDQANPAVAMTPVGAFVVTWDSPDGSYDGVFAQRYALSQLSRLGRLP